MKYRIFTATFLLSCLIGTLANAQLRLAAYTHSEYTSVGNKFWVKDSIRYDCYKHTSGTEGKFQLPEYDILYTKAFVFEASSSTANLELQKRHTSTFDGSNHLTEVLIEEPDGSGWKNDAKIEINYVSGKPDTVYYYSWSTWGGGSWRSSSRIAYTWNGNNVASATRETRTMSGWRNDWRKSYTYSSGMQTSYTEEDWSGSAWVNKNKTTTTYAGGKKSEVLLQEWQSGAWVDKEKDKYTYTGNDLTNVETEFYVAPTWFKSYKNTYTYNGKSTPDSMVRQNWDDLQSLWVNNIRFELKHNTDKKTYEETSSWDGNMWIKTQNIDSLNQWYYDWPVSVTEVANADNRVKVYPSPASDVLNIEVANTSADVKLTIVDMTGRVQKALTANTNDIISVSVSHLPAGNYILSVDDGNGIKTEQFVINR